MAMTFTSPAFQEGETIPSKYTCSEEDVSPPLQWDSPPKETRTFALIMDDPDAPAGTWVHWVLFNIPGDRRSLPEAFPPEESFPTGEVHGINGFERIGYGGPCPPPGTPHRYYFKLYALDTALVEQPGATKADVLVACKNHILAEAQLMGRFGR